MIRSLPIIASVGVPEFAIAAAPSAAAPLATQFLISAALMGIAGAFLLWDGLVVARKRRQLRAARAAAAADKG